MLSKEQLQGTSAEALVAERLGEIPVGQVAVFYHLVPQVPFGQWKIECDCSPVTGLHHAVASACEWSIAAFHPVMGAAGLKVYNVVPGVERMAISRTEFARSGSKARGTAK